VAVDVEGRLRVLVPQHPLHHRQGVAGLEQQRGGGVAVMPLSA
jgi:hypothetical protein